VAKRVLERMRTIKLEAEGSRRPLEVSVGLAAWQTNMAASDLLARSSAAASTRNGDRNGEHRAVEPAGHAWHSPDGATEAVGQVGRGPVPATGGTAGS